MNRTIPAVVALFLSVSLFADDTQQYLVATKRPFRSGAVREILRDARNGIVLRDVVGFETFTGFAAKLTSSEVAELRRSREVRWVEPVIERHAFSINTEQAVPYGIDLVNARQAWIGRRAGAVNVAVLDTGIDYVHQDLEKLFAGGHNHIDPTASARDDGKHGTHVSGTIAAADNGQGVVGVAPHAETRLWAVKVLDGSGYGSNATIIKGIDWVVAQKNALGGNWIINMSLGSHQPSPGEREGINRALDAGIIVVAAAGNYSRADLPAPVAYPAAYPGVVAVGAVDEDGKVAPFSGQGPELEITAPGVDVLSTVPAGVNFLTTLAAGAEKYKGTQVTGSATGTITADYVYCGLGNAGEFPKSVKGKIALIKRGDLPFATKARNAVDAGAIGVVFFNNGEIGNRWTLRSDKEPWSQDYAFPIAVGITEADGLKLQQQQKGRITVSHEPNDYGYLSGTSMATPHVAGAAALIWSMAPDATAAQVIDALVSTAADHGTPGHDSLYGAGVLDVNAAAKRLAPHAFSGQPSTGRPIGKRGRG